MKILNLASPIINNLIFNQQIYRISKMIDNSQLQYDLSPYYQLRNYSVHPLTDQGFIQYISKQSHVHKYISIKKDPKLIDQYLNTTIHNHLNDSKGVEHVLTTEGNETNKFNNELQKENQVITNHSLNR